MADGVIRIGTRKSQLARWQTDHVAALLKAQYSGVQVDIVPFSTKGDQILDKALPAIGGKGVFTAELEAALYDGRIDLAVHSLKDLPTEAPDGLIVGAVPQRADPRDVLVSKNKCPLAALPHGAIIGTSSRRRAAQIRAVRPDVVLRDIRGNVETRINKALTGDYDATILAYAGLSRLELLHHAGEILPLDVMLNAPGQGALGVQCRDDAHSRELLAPLTHTETWQAVTAERAFMAALGGGCSVPIAAYGQLVDGQLHLRGRVSAVDGVKQINVERMLPLNDDLTAQTLGQQAAADAIDAGAKAILAGLVE
jgi:hydroxymethylbilane synthase